MDYDEPTVSEFAPIPQQNLRAFSSILLALMIITAFLGNLFLLGTIISSATLRRSVFCLCILNLAVINLLETGVNLFISLLYVTIGSWKLGTGVCRLNAALGALLGLQTLVGITLLSIDRAIALLSLAKYEQRQSKLRFCVALLGVWIVGLCLSVPLLIGSISVNVFAARYFCSIWPGNPLGFTVAVLLIYILVFIVLLMSFAMILYRAHEERNGRRSLLPDRVSDYTDFIMDNRQFLDQLDLGKFCVVIFLVYFLLHGPYMLLNFIEQFRNSQELLSTHDGKLEIPPAAETAITWLKFVYPVVFPFFVFGFNRNIWRKFKALICCRKTNMVSTTTRDTLPVPGQNIARDENPEDNNIPTLVATSGGLHLRTAQVDDFGNQREEYAFADIHDRQIRRRRTSHEGTSDYDSEESGSWSEAHPEMFRTVNNPRIRPPKTEIIGDIQKTQLEVAVTPRGLRDTTASIENHENLENYQDEQGRLSVETLASSSQVRLHEIVEKERRNKNNAAERHNRTKSDANRRPPKAKISVEVHRRKSDEHTGNFATPDTDLMPVNANFDGNLPTNNEKRRKISGNFVFDSENSPKKGRISEKLPKKERQKVRVQDLATVTENTGSAPRGAAGDLQTMPSSPKRPLSRERTFTRLPKLSEFQLTERGRRNSEPIVKSDSLKLPSLSGNETAKNVEQYSDRKKTKTKKNVKNFTPKKTAQYQKLK